MRGCYNEWAFNWRYKMLPKRVWKMMLALDKYFWRNNKNKKTHNGKNLRTFTSVGLWFRSSWLVGCGGCCCFITRPWWKERFRRRIVLQFISLIYPADKGDIKVYWVSKWTVLSRPLFHNEFNTLLVLQSSYLEVSCKQHTHHLCLYP